MFIPPDLVFTLPSALWRRGFLAVSCKTTQADQAKHFRTGFSPPRSPSAQWLACMMVIDCLRFALGIWCRIWGVDLSWAKFWLKIRLDFRRKFRPYKAKFFSMFLAITPTGHPIWRQKKTTAVCSAKPQQLCTFAGEASEERAPCWGVLIEPCRTNI